MKIFLVDLKNDIIGHYHIMKVLSSIDETVEIDTSERKIRFKKNPILFFKERINIIKRTSILIKEQSNNSKVIIHYLTVDKFYFLYMFFPSYIKNNNIVATLHHIPSNFLLIYALKRFSKFTKCILVLSEYLKIELNKMNINNVVAIQHPTFYNYRSIDNKQLLRDRMNLKNNDLIFSFLGGTRFEKGLDILLESFNYLQEEEKKKIILNIAGVENDFNREYIENKVKQYNIKCRLTLRRLSDKDFMENVVISDYVVIPYRKTFNAMSGPLSEAFSQGINCILPRYGIFKYYGEIQKNNNLMFESENPESLAKCISYSIRHTCTLDDNVIRMFQKETFTKNVNDLYKQFNK